MFIIGKSKSPRCLKGIKHLPCRYRNQNKSWMDSILFEEWIREMDTKFTKEKKKVMFIIGNCLAHPTVDNLKSIELIFLPPNTTSKLQPMDQGIIRSLKVYYRYLALQRLVVAIDKKKIFLFSHFCTTAEDVVFADESLISTEPLLTDEQLVKEVKNAANEHDDNDEEDNDDDNAIDPVYPKVSDIRETLQVLYDYMPFSLVGESLQQKLNAVSIIFDRDVSSKLKQSDIRTFFNL
nr:tigger transposable element-derived protein 4-like [Hydra vulgaris]